MGSMRLRGRSRDWRSGSDTGVADIGLLDRSVWSVVFCTLWANLSLSENVPSIVETFLYLRRRTCTKVSHSERLCFSGMFLSTTPTEVRPCKLLILLRKP